jgi:GNAT superfamily N-acetyltransferase
VSDVTLRDATAADLPVILGYVRALAAYERLEHLVTAGEEHFRAAMFGPSPLVFGVIAEIADRPVGFALWYRTFSTFTGTPSLYVEDVFVEEDHRDRGIGRALFRHLARTAVAQGCARMEWAVLDWNAPAITFYRGLGAEPVLDWTKQRLAGPALAALAH